MSLLNGSLYPAQDLPERVLQFGTGVLLRGLPDFFIDKANQQGLFNGRIVVVKSTGGRTDAFSDQDNRYTLVTRGLENGQAIEEQRVVTAISRVISAQDNWPAVLQAARNPHLQIVISNTTEVGIQYVEESIFQSPPQSFPGKLTAFLYERFKNFGGSKHKGMVVVPTELLPENGLRLRDTVERLARHNELGKLFMKWLKFHVRFCNSLVDRIVPGVPEDEARQELEQALGYEDKLLTVAEPYRLWAIEGDERVREMLSFAGADPGVVIEEDITFYRERKLRILNGGHTISVPMGYLLGLETVRDCMEHPLMSRFMEEVITQEIVPTVPTLGAPDEPDPVGQFASAVLDRFRNPHIVHYLLNITLQSTSKMRARNLPSLQRYYDRFDRVPQRMALGFAAYLRFMRAVRIEDNTYLGEVNALGGLITYPIRDDQADYYYRLWQRVEEQDLVSVRQFVLAVCGDTTLWEADLNALPGFVEAVTEHLISLLRHGAEATLEKQLVTA